jgi:hypothetical protein
LKNNVCDNIIYTLLNDGAKSKDHLNVRKDLQVMSVRLKLWADKKGKYPPIIYTLTNQGKKVLQKTLMNITLPLMGIQATFLGALMWIIID